MQALCVVACYLHKLTSRNWGPQNGKTHYSDLLALWDARSCFRHLSVFVLCCTEPVPSLCNVLCCTAGLSLRLRSRSVLSRRLLRRVSVLLRRHERRQRWLHTAPGGGQGRGHPSEMQLVRCVGVSTHECNKLFQLSRGSQGVTCHTLLGWGFEMASYCPWGTAGGKVGVVGVSH